MSEFPNSEFRFVISTIGLPYISIFSSLASKLQKHPFFGVLGVLERYFHIPDVRIPEVRARIRNQRHRFALYINFQLPRSNNNKNTPCGGVFENWNAIFDPFHPEFRKSEAANRSAMPENLIYIGISPLGALLLEIWKKNVNWWTNKKKYYIISLNCGT